MAVTVLVTFKFVALTVLVTFQIQQIITNVSEENARIIGVLLTQILETLYTFKTSIAVYR